MWICRLVFQIPSRAICKPWMSFHYTPQLHSILQDFSLPRGCSHLSAKRSKFRMPNFLLFEVFRRTLKIPGENPVVRIINLVQIQNTLRIVQKRNPLHFLHIHPLLVNILACLDVSRLAKIGGVACYQNEWTVVETDQGSLQPGGSDGTPDDYWLTPNHNIKHVL